MRPPLSMLFALLLASCGQGQEDKGVEIAQAGRERVLPMPAIAGPTDTRLPLVVIDPGHGGRDPGAVSPVANRLLEKDMTLEIARAMRRALLESGRFRVALTRDGDAHVALEDRPEIARRLRAALLISVHADAAERPGARGASLYTLSEIASDREAAALAARENASAVGAAPSQASGEVNRILFDLAQRETLESAARLAELIHREGEALFPFQPDYRRFASLIVLKAPDVPSILFETGYLTNEEDAVFLQSSEGRHRIAQAVAQAVDAFFARKRFTPGPASARAGPQ